MGASRVERQKLKRKEKAKTRKTIFQKSFKTFLIIFVIGCMLLFGYFKITNKSIKDIMHGTQKLPKTQISMKINSAVTFENAKSSGLVNIENKENNNYDMVIEIYLKNTNEKVYTSKKIQPGEKIEKIKLSKELNKGTYKAIAYFKAYDDDSNYKGKSGAEIVINVKE